jgi:hypothetical protein
LEHIRGGIIMRICVICKKEITDDNRSKDERDVHEKCMKRVYAGEEDKVEFKEGDTSICMHCGEPIVCVKIEEDVEPEDSSDEENDNEIVTWGAYFKHKVEPGSKTCAQGGTGAYPINSAN